MLRHFLIAALHNMAANRLQSVVAIFGLSVGLWAAITAGIVIHNQSHFDSFIPGSQRIYLVALENSYPGMVADYYWIPRHTIWRRCCVRSFRKWKRPRACKTAVPSCAMARPKRGSI